MKVTVNFRVEKNVRDEAREIFESIGIDMTSALNIFLKQVIKDREIPFRLKADNLDVREELLDKFIEEKIASYEKRLEKDEITEYNSMNVLQESKAKYGL